MEELKIFLAEQLVFAQKKLDEEKQCEIKNIGDIRWYQGYKRAIENVINCTKKS